MKTVKVLQVALATAFLAVLFISLFNAIASLIKEDQTARLVQAEAELYAAAPQTEIIPKQDAWGHDLQYSVVADPTHINALVVSPGPDGRLNTTDDVQGSKQNLNKSRIVGEWTSTKAKEFFKGIWDGINKKSEFEAR